MTTIRAAGGVVWRDGPAGPQVAVIHRPRHGDWTLPKGKLDAGESEAEAACREVGEEVGVGVRLGADLGIVRYHVDGRPKTVRYWSMAAGPGGFEPSDEVDRLRWLEPEQARRCLTYPLDREVLDRFLALPAEKR